MNNIRVEYRISLVNSEVIDVETAVNIALHDWRRSLPVWSRIDWKSLEPIRMDGNDDDDDGVRRWSMEITMLTTRHSHLLWIPYENVISSHYKEYLRRASSCRSPSVELQFELCSLDFFALIFYYMDSILRLLLMHYNDDDDGTTLEMTMSTTRHSHL